MTQWSMDTLYSALRTVAFNVMEHHHYMVHISEEDPPEPPPRSPKGPLIGSIVFGIIIALATVVSLAPQSISFLRFRTSRGISFLTLWIGYTTASFVAIGASVLSYDWVLEEMRHLAHGNTHRLLNLANQSVVIGQLAVLAIMYFVNVTLYIVFAWVDLKTRYSAIQTGVLDNDEDVTLDEMDAMHVSTKDKLDLAIGYTFYDSRQESQVYRSKRRILVAHTILYVVTALFLALLCVGCAIYLSFQSQDSYIDSLAHSLGYISTVVIFVQWIPQIAATYLAKSPGNFSILMMCLLCPGAFIIMVYLSATGQSISVWASYLVSGLQQIVLLTLLIYYSVQEKLAARKQKSEENAQESNSDSREKNQSPMSLSEEARPLKDATSHKYQSTEDHV